ncbi:hypothetical protein [Pseudoalteromonas rubra]|uniref:HEAT repeat domain-containing protein n=1 Tax=Pseudoalteromonas rubra TaxID=43658 RepID=A0A5S3WYR1_9GAMM|nr:hypothetical protein [Pseudoalteromonas rubra]TMP35836.1 hypothetical protein CWB98_15405 [Pseudoalteromonas rubra]
MLPDSFTNALSESNSVECIESTFFEYVEKMRFKDQIRSMIDRKDYDYLGKVNSKGITLFENEKWIMRITQDAFHTRQDVASTFASDALYCVISDHHYLVSIYPEHHGALQNPESCQQFKTKHLKVMSNNYAYEFHGQQEKVVVVLRSKTISRDVCHEYNIKSGSKIATYSGTQNLERYKVLTSFLPQFGAVAAPYLVGLTKHAVNAIRWQALVELFKVDHQQAKSILIEFTEDPCQIVRAQAKNTLEQLTAFEQEC